MSGRFWDKSFHDLSPLHHSFWNMHSKHSIVGLKIEDEATGSAKRNDQLLSLFHMGTQFFCSKSFRSKKWNAQGLCSYAPLTRGCSLSIPTSFQFLEGKHRLFPRERIDCLSIFVLCSPGNAIDLFAIWRERPKRARPVLAALLTVGNQENLATLLIIVQIVPRLHLTANSSYFQFIFTFKDLHDTFLVW